MPLTDDMVRDRIIQRKLIRLANQTLYKHGTANDRVVMLISVPEHVRCTFGSTMHAIRKAVHSFS